MTCANAGTLGAMPGHRDEPMDHLTAHNAALQQAGCLAHEVRVRADEVQSVIAAARPIVSGVLGGFSFEVIGSPLRQ